MKRSFLESSPAHLLLLPLYFVVHKFSVLCRPYDSERFASITSWLGNFVLALLFSLIPGIVLYKFLNSIIKVPKIQASIISTLLVMVFFLESELEFFSQFNSPLIRKRYFLFPGCVIIIYLIVKALKSNRFAEHVNSYLNLLWTGLIVYNLAILITVLPQVKSSTYIPETVSFNPSCEKCPDIYYIILDAYTSNESLKNYWHYDNAAFTDSLKRMGFYIADSRTNFIHTYYSIASTLNMSNDSAEINQMHRYDVMRLVKNNIVVHKMIEAGYQFDNLSIFDIANSSAYYNFSYVYESSEKNILSRFLNNTLFRSITTLFAEADTYERHLKMLHKLESVPATKINRPRFVYAHLLAPHQPYVMDSLSQQIPFYKLSKTNDKASYLNQLKGVNKLVLKTLDSILKGYDRNYPPVIILQGDHGFRYLQDNPDESTTILNAYYFPEGMKALYPGISPYNTFRVVFNTYFKSNLNLLEETHPSLEESNPK